MLIHNSESIHKQRCLTMQKHCWGGVCPGVLCHSEWRVKQWDGRRKAGSHQSGRCFQISETFRSSLAGPSDNLYNLFIFSASLHLLSKLQPAAKKRKGKNFGQPPTSPALLCHTICYFPSYFYLWHILSQSVPSIHCFILPNLQSSSIRLTFPPVYPSLVIHLSLHFPLLSITVELWLFHSLNPCHTDILYAVPLWKIEKFLSSFISGSPDPILISDII